jgi:membrane protease YdiL (CAAX protease family)
MGMTDPKPSVDPPPWTGLDIAVALFFLYLFWPLLSLELLKASGWAERLYGPGVKALYGQKHEETGSSTEEREAERIRVGILAGPGAALLDVVEGEARRLLGIRLNLWAGVLVFPLQAATVPVVFYALSGVRPGRIGLTTRRFWRNVLAGIGGWLLITPLVFGINMLVEYLTRMSDPDAGQQHALAQLAEQGATGVEWMLIVFSVVVMAPVLEETVFRGVLQPWFAGFRNGGAAAMTAAFAVALLMRQTLFLKALQDHGSGLLRAALPGLFVLALVPFYLAVARRPPRPESPALFGTAVLFASVHSSVWPTPVPLFVLGLALGTLAARTGSLTGPIVLHGLFNSVTIVVLMIGS